MVDKSDFVTTGKFLEEKIGDFTDVSKFETLIERINNKFPQLTQLQSKVIDYVFDEEGKQKGQFGSLVVAPTGVGKTLCFAIPALTWVDVAQPTLRQEKKSITDRGKREEITESYFMPQVVIVADSQSLIDQISQEIVNLVPLDKEDPLSKIKVQKFYQGIKLCEMFGQDGNLEGFHIFVTTPHLLAATLLDPKKKPFRKASDVMTWCNVDIRNLKMFVIDEAEQVVDGFREDIDKFISVARQNRKLNIMLTSATLDKTTIDDFKQKWHTAETKNQPIYFQLFKLSVQMTVSQYGLQLEQRGKPFESARAIVVRTLDDIYRAQNLKTQVMIFLESIKAVDEMLSLLKEDPVILKLQIVVEAYHSRVNEKEKKIKEFRQGTVDVLLSTNVLARGIDIIGVSLVINVFAPRKGERNSHDRNSHEHSNNDPLLDPKIYVHRVGRTGRFDQKGVALTLYKPRDEKLSQQDCELEHQLIDFMASIQGKEVGIKLPEDFSKLSKQEQQRIKKDLETQNVNKIKKEFQESHNTRIKPFEEKDFIEEIKAVIKFNKESEAHHKEAEQKVIKKQIKHDEEKGPGDKEAEEVKSDEKQ